MTEHPHAHLIRSLEQKIADKEHQVAALLARGIAEEHRLVQGFRIWITKLEQQIVHLRQRHPDGDK